MSVTINAQTIISAAAVVAALGALFAVYNRGYAFVKRQEKQDKELALIREEQKLLTRGVLACLKGLKEQGCNGPVSDAIHEIEDHLLKEAHKDV